MAKSFTISGLAEPPRVTLNGRTVDVAPPDRPSRSHWRDHDLDAFHPAGICQCCLGRRCRGGRQERKRADRKPHASAQDSRFPARCAVVGCGTWRTFDVGNHPAERAPLAEVLNVLFEAGGSVIDTSPMYGAAEGVVGDLLAAAARAARPSSSTKVWTSGPQQRHRADDAVDGAAQDRSPRPDAIHNLLDWRAICRRCAPGRPRDASAISASPTTRRAPMTSSRPCCAPRSGTSCSLN